MAFVAPVVGASPTRRTVAKEFNLGTTLTDDVGDTYTYVQAPAAVALNGVVILTQPANTVATGAGAFTATAAFAAGEYGFVKHTVKTLLA